MRKANYSVGDKYGRLTIKEIFKRPIGKRGRIVISVGCVCDCGGETITNITNLRRGTTKSCGCLSEEKKIKHKKCFSGEYQTWSHMKQRCFNKNNQEYNNYGGRGITVCDKWLDFRNFYADMGERPAGKTLDRVNNNGNYCKENCRWATQKEQSNNVRRNIIIELNGKRRPLYWWSEKLNIKSHTIYTRIIRGWSASDSLKPLWGKQNDSV